MRLLADENVPGDLVNGLRAAEQDVVWVRRDAPGASDEEILQWAQREARVVLTFDKDFGDLAYESRLPASSGIILVRIQRLDGPAIARLSVLLASRDDWAGHFSVVGPDRVRMREPP